MELEVPFCRQRYNFTTTLLNPPIHKITNMMNKESNLQPNGNSAASNDVSQRQSSQNSPSVSDDSNNEQGISQRGQVQEPNVTTDSTADRWDTLLQCSLISQNDLSSTNIERNRFEMGRRNVELDRSLHSFITEAIQISEEALTEMRGQSDQQVVSSTTQISRQESFGSDIDRDESNTSEE
jgi:hypothetical protein